MDIILENDFLRVTLSTHGAEITSVIKKQTNDELLWCADPEVWNRHAPILFPWCGNLKDNGFTHNGVNYTGKGHGFARDLDHVLLEARSTVAVFSLAANAITMEKFPFVFKLTTTYRLEGQTLRHECLVENEGDWDMNFALGYHPGFNCPFDENHEITDYELRFDCEQSPIEIDTGAGGLCTGNETPLFKNGAVIPLTADIFAKDSICMKNINAKTLSLVEKDTGRSISVNVENFPFVLIWSAHGPIKFVCIEPWYGLPDTVDATGVWREKAHTINLEKGEAWSASLAMDFAR